MTFARSCIAATARITLSVKTEERIGDRAMKRKRFIKLLMAEGFQRNEITSTCGMIRFIGGSYQSFYEGWKFFAKRYGVYDKRGKG